MNYYYLRDLYRNENLQKCYVHVLFFLMTLSSQKTMMSFYF